MKIIVVTLFLILSNLLFAQENKVVCTDIIEYKNLKVAIMNAQKLEVWIDILDLKTVNNDTIVLYKTEEWVKTSSIKIKHTIRAVRTTNIKDYIFADYENNCQVDKSSNDFLTLGKININN